MTQQFDQYGRMAVAGVSNTTQNGRYLIQREAEKLIPSDVMKKLDIKETDSFLDVGCGMGLNLLTIGKQTKEAFGCDHPKVIENILEKEDVPDNVHLMPGSFLDIDFGRTFNKILIYSVLIVLPDKKTVYSFVDKALSMLEPNGRAVFGDFANVDKKKRFMEGARGKDFQKKWDRLRSETLEEDELTIFQDGPKPIIMGDKFILELLLYIREKGFHAYIEDQPQDLPFGNTREDIVVVGPEYKEI